MQESEQHWSVFIIFFSNNIDALRSFSLGCCLRWQWTQRNGQCSSAHDWMFAWNHVRRYTLSAHHFSEAFAAHQSSRFWHGSATSLFVCLFLFFKLWGIRETCVANQIRLLCFFFVFFSSFLCSREYQLERWQCVKAYAKLWSYAASYYRHFCLPVYQIWA